MTEAFKRGFMDKMAELNKRAYELGSTSKGGLFSGLRSTADNFKPEDPLIGEPGGSLGLVRNPEGEGYIGLATHYTPAPGTAAAGDYSDMFFDNPDNWRPHTVDEQIAGYNDSIKDRDGLIRRVPIVEDGEFNSTYWKDNKDLANLQADAIRRRRGAGKPMVFNKELKRYRLPQD